MNCKAASLDDRVNDMGTIKDNVDIDIIETDRINERNQLKLKAARVVEVGAGLPLKTIN